MTNKQIIEDYKSGIFYRDFVVFYCKKLDEHVIPRLPLNDAEKDTVLSEFQKNNEPPVGYAISIKSNKAVMKRILTKKVSNTISFRTDV
jgi:hypothetical protein